MANKRLYKLVERWINKRYAPDDIEIEVDEKHIGFEAKDKIKGAKYDEKYLDRLAGMIDGALYFTMDMEERRKGVRRFRG